MNKSIKSISLALVLLLQAANCQAATINGLFNTGVETAGITLTGGASDPHYTLDTLGGTGAIVTSSIPGSWLANTTTSRWIAPSANQAVGEAPNPGADVVYTYHYSFDLTGFSPAGVVLAGRWATDNGGIDLLLNGNATGLVNNSGFTVWTNFSLSSGFQTGINTLDFVVSNIAFAQNNPTGLRVEWLSATGNTAVPLPPGIWLLASGLMGLVLWQRRGRKG